MKKEKKRKAVCIDCKEPLGQVRLVVAGCWICPDCLYEREHGEAERAPVNGHPSHPQEETLFPLEPYKRLGA